MHEIVNRLTELMEQNRAIIQPRQLRANDPLHVLTLQQLDQYGKNFDERAQLHEELRRLSGEKIDD
jgi:hypothetical protein